MARRRNKEAAETLERELAALRAGTAVVGAPAPALTDAPALTEAANLPAYRAPSPPPAAVPEVYAPEGVSEDEDEDEPDANAQAGASPPSHLAVWQPKAEPDPSPSAAASAGAASGKAAAPPRAARAPSRGAGRAAAALGGNGLSPHKWGRSSSATARLPLSRSLLQGRLAAPRAQGEPPSRIGPTSGLPA